MVIIKMYMSSRTKRGTLSITENILQALKDGEQLKTHIAYKSKIDSRTIEKYLPLLMELHLVERAQEDRYRITKKGLQYLKKYDELKEYGVIDDSTR
jgi:predicted transcriptional regulator